MHAIVWFSFHQDAITYALCNMGFSVIAPPHRCAPGVFIWRPPEARGHQFMMTTQIYPVYSGWFQVHNQDKPAMLP
jgi:hypothetical protein